MLVYVTSRDGVNACSSFTTLKLLKAMCEAPGVPRPSPRASTPLTITAAPGAGWKPTSEADVFEESASISSAGYVPPAICTTWPGCATRYARSKLRQGAACVHGPESEPPVETNTLGVPPDGGGGQAAVEAEIDVF